MVPIRKFSAKKAEIDPELLHKLILRGTYLGLYTIEKSGTIYS